jgi:hypothetical protein
VEGGDEGEQREPGAALHGRLYSLCPGKLPERAPRFRV